MSKRGLFKSMLFLGVSIAAVVSVTTVHELGVAAEQPAAVTINRSSRAPHSDALNQSQAQAAAAAAAAKVAAAKPVATTQPTASVTTVAKATTTQVSQPAPAKAATAPCTTAHVRTTATKRETARTITMGGTSIHYIIGSQSMKAAPASGAATWGGQTRYSNTSGQNTHFIGHNPGAFAVLTSLGIGSAIRVTDGAGVGRTYHVYQIAKVNPNGVTANHVDLWNQITGTGGGQRITLQTCLGSYWREIVFAR